MKFIELSTELEEEFLVNDFLWELLGADIHEHPESEVVKSSDSRDTASCGKEFVHDSTLYRKAAILRWRKKRERRCFKRRIVSKARKEYAESRERKGGRFVKSKSVGWVAITDINHGV